MGWLGVAERSLPVILFAVTILGTATSRQSRQHVASGLRDGNDEAWKSRKHVCAAESTASSSTASQSTSRASGKLRRRLAETRRGIHRVRRQHFTSLWARKGSRRAGQATSQIEKRRVAGDMERDKALRSGKKRKLKLKQCCPPRGPRALSALQTVLTLRFCRLISFELSRLPSPSSSSWLVAFDSRRSHCSSRFCSVDFFLPGYAGGLAMLEDRTFHPKSSCHYHAAAVAARRSTIERGLTRSLFDSVSDLRFLSLSHSLALSQAKCPFRPGRKEAGKARSLSITPLSLRLSVCVSCVRGSVCQWERIDRRAARAPD